MTTTLRTCTAWLLVLCCAPALAQYRCGNVFQDRPCESGTQINLSPSGRPLPSQPTTPGAVVRSAPPANAATFAIACSRIGEQAQRITWKREGGATQEQQLAERATMLSPEDHAKTVAGVYARRGSATEIRSSIEAECMAEKEKQAQSAELLKQLRRDAGESAAAPATTTPARTADNAPSPTSTKPSASQCASLKRQVDDARARLAGGGSSRQMESLQNDRRSAEASLRSSGC